MTYSAPLKATLQPRRLRGGRGAEAAQEHHREGGLSRRAAAHHAARHVRHQRRRARRRQPAAPLAGRGVRGGHAPERPAADLGAHHPVPRLVGRVHRRHPRRDLRPHRQEEEVPGHGAAPRVRLRDQRGHPAALLRRPKDLEHHREARGPAGEASEDHRARCLASTPTTRRSPEGADARRETAGRQGRRRAHPGAAATSAAQGHRSRSRCSPATRRSTCATRRSSRPSTRDRQNHVLAFDAADPETGEVVAEGGQRAHRHAAQEADQGRSPQGRGVASRPAAPSRR